MPAIEFKCSKHPKYKAKNQKPFYYVDGELCPECVSVREAVLSARREQTIKEGRCPDHPRYRGSSEPRPDCEKCVHIYNTTERKDKKKNSEALWFKDAQASLERMEKRLREQVVSGAGKPRKMTIHGQRVSVVRYPSLLSFNTKGK